MNDLFGLCLQFVMNDLFGLCLQFVSFNLLYGKTAFATILRYIGKSGG